MSALHSSAWYGVKFGPLAIVDAKSFRQVRSWLNGTGGSLKSHLIELRLLLPLRRTCTEQYHCDSFPAKWSPKVRWRQNQGTQSKSVVQRIAKSRAREVPWR